MKGKARRVAARPLRERHRSDDGAGGTSLDVVGSGSIELVHSQRDGDRGGAARRNSNEGSAARPGATIDVMSKAQCSAIGLNAPYNSASNYF